MRWEQGRPAIDGMLARGELERIPADRVQAERLLSQARDHLKSSLTIAASDPAGAYQLLYDAARKSLCAMLENQGLRATSRGGHVVVYEAVVAQLDPPMGLVLRPFDRMRRRRNDAEYPRIDAPGVTADEALRDVSKVERILGVATGVLDQMSPY